MSYHHILDQIFDEGTKIVKFKTDGPILQRVIMVVTNTQKSKHTK